MKTKKIQVRQGFTIVELVIVIGVIGVLTAVLIPTFINLNKKAEEASNQAFVKNLNTQMAIREQEEGKNSNMFDAVLDAKEIGFDVEKLTPVNGRDLVWDSVANRFLLLNEDGSVFYGKDDKKAEKDLDLWKIYSAMPAESEQKYSIYAKADWATPTVAGVKVGFDTGYANITALTYDGTQDVTLHTKNDACVLTINAPSANVDFYGFASVIDVKDVKAESLHIYGAVNKLQVEKGHVAVENTGIVFDVAQVGAKDTGVGATITNKGFIAKASMSEHTSEEAKTAAAGKVSGDTVGGDYGINSLARLESFRDAVNSGSSFEGLTVKLTSDITLNNGWTPIGEGSRKAGADFNGHISGNPNWKISGTAFQGTFDGQDHTISNLNNKGFTPNQYRLGNGSIYSYGLFAITASPAKITNLKLSNVDIDTSRYSETEAVGDSVGAVVGFSAGALKLENVKVLSGNVTAKEAVGGLVGRAYRQDQKTEVGKVEFKGCENNATVKATVQNGAGLLGFASALNYLDVEFSNCLNKGNVSASYCGAGFMNYGDESNRTVIMTGNDNQGNVSVNGAGRAAHIVEFMNQHLNGSNKETLGNKVTLSATSNTHSASAKVTIKANSDAPDQTSADNNFIWYNDANFILKAVD